MSSAENVDAHVRARAHTRASAQGGTCARAHAHTEARALNFFSDVAINLEVDRELHTNVSDAGDPVIITFVKYHPIIIKLKQSAFYHIPESYILKIIQGIDSSKTYQKDNIPPKLPKKNIDICSIILTNIDICSIILTNDVCRCIENGTFTDNLKNADIIPTFKKDDRLKFT